MDGLFGSTVEVRRLKPLPCYRRATDGPNSFEFGTAVARRLEQALVITKICFRSVCYCFCLFGEQEIVVSGSVAFAVTPRS